MMNPPQAALPSPPADEAPEQTIQRLMREVDSLKRKLKEQSMLVRDLKKQLSAKEMVKTGANLSSKFRNESLGQVVDVLQYVCYTRIHISHTKSKDKALHIASTTC